MVVEIKRFALDESSVPRLILSIVLSLLGGLSLLIFLSKGFTSFNLGKLCFSLVCSLVFAYLWLRLLQNSLSLRCALIFSIFSMLFALFLVVGQIFDSSSRLPSPPFIALLSLGIAVAVFPCAVFVATVFGGGQSAQSPHLDKKVVYLSFGVLACCWFLGWLAAFPGSYGQDAPYWFLEFSNPKYFISSQWSPVYAWLFYIFVSGGQALFGWHGYGLAVFSFLQMVFVLYSAYRVMSFAGRECGNVACVLVAAFYALVPTHMIMSISTAQGTPCMACVALAAIHFARMILHSDEYWSNIRNPLACIGWCIAAGICRNNMLYALVFMVLLLPLIHKHRRKVAAVLIAAIAGIVVYSGPILDAAGVVKGSATREMLSLPLQQLAYVYNYQSQDMTIEQQDDLRKYVPEEALESYKDFPSISDALKSNLDTTALMNNTGDCLRLYFQVGFQAPLAYAKAFYLQNLGLLYFDKSYPDLRIWHHYLHYAGSSETITAFNSDYIVMERHSLFPVYDEFLKWLFGHDPSGYDWAGHDSAAFDNVPFLDIVCRVSTYFWLLLFMMFVGWYRHWRSEFFVLGLFIGITITVLLAPVVLYRYYAAVVFCAPVMCVLLAKAPMHEYKAADGEEDQRQALMPA